MKNIFANIKSFFSFGNRVTSIPSTNRTNWRNDFAILVNSLLSIHPNIFCKISKCKFYRKIVALKIKSKKRADYETMIHLYSLLSKVGDTHTQIMGCRVAYNQDRHNASLALREDFHRIPIQLYWFSDGIYVINAINDYAHLIGRKISRIGNYSIEQAVNKLSLFIYNDNHSYFKLAIQQALISAEFLKVVDIIDSLLNVSITFDCGFQCTVLTRLVSENLTWQPLPPNAPLYLQESNSDYSYSHFNNMLYIHYNACPSERSLNFDNFERQIINILSNYPINKLVFDLRMNGGGSSSLASNIINTIAAHNAINQRNHLFVVIGRRTFSSGMLNALDLKYNTNAILIGEPTSGEPIHFGEIKQILLPNSGIQLFCSSKCFNSYVNETTTSLTPEIEILLSSTDYFSNIDPILDYITRQ